MKWLGLNSSIAAALALVSIYSSAVIAQKKTDPQHDDRALREFAIAITDTIEKSKVDLADSFRVEIILLLEEAPNLEASATKLVQQDGNEKIASLVVDTVKAFARSGYFQPLSSLGVRDLRITVRQADEIFTAQFESIFPNPARAKNSAQAFNLLFATQPSIERSGDTRLVTAVPIWLNNVRAHAEHEKLIISFQERSHIVQKLFRQQLDRLTTVEK